MMCLTRGCGDDVINMGGAVSAATTMTVSTWGYNGDDEMTTLTWGQGSGGDNHILELNLITDECMNCITDLNIWMHV